MSDAEETLAFQLRAVGIEFEREVRFIPDRRFRADFLVRAPGRGTDILVEVDGGAFIGGRHSTGTGVEKDAEKQSLAAAEGYRVVRCTPRQVNSGDCLKWIEASR